MDSKRFDALSRSLATAGTRRGLLSLLAGWPLAGLLALLPEAPVEGAGRRHRRKKRRKHHHGDAKDNRKGHRNGKDKGKHKDRAKNQPASPAPPPPPSPPGCVPEPTTVTCAGRCASVPNNCGDAVACGPCTCASGCPPCQACNPATGLCDAEADDTPCDDGDACTQTDTCQGGVCTGSNPVACTAPPVCHTTIGATCVAGTGACTYPIEPNGTACGSGQVCCGGDCLSGTCCTNAECAGTPTTPICQDHTCVACTSNSQCGADQVCALDGTCHACDVICTGTPAACGQALQTKIDGGGPLYVCAGAYRPPSATGFTISSGVTLIGAGEGESPDSNTVLDANREGRVLLIAGGAVELQRLRVTGGQSGDNGAGILHQGSTLEMTECTVAGNTSTNVAGGGIYAESGHTLMMTRCTVRDNQATDLHGDGAGIWTAGTTTLTDCLIEANTAGYFGGGIAVYGATRLVGNTLVQGNHATDRLGNGGGGGIFLTYPSSVIIEETCQVTRNTAPSGRGGGIFIFGGGTVTLLGADTPSPIVFDNCPENCDGLGTDVPNCSTVPPAGPCP